MSEAGLDGITDRQKSQLKDMVAFINYGLEDGKDFGWILSNLGHDVGGLVRQERNFLPRSDGYTAIMAKRASASE